MWLKGWAKKRLLKHLKACFSSTRGIFLSVHTISRSNLLQRTLGFSSRWSWQSRCTFTKQASDTAAWLIVCRGFFSSELSVCASGLLLTSAGTYSESGSHLFSLPGFSCLAVRNVSGWIVASLWNETRGSWDWLWGPPPLGHSPAPELLHRSHGAGKWRKCRRKKTVWCGAKEEAGGQKNPFSEI